MKLNQLCHGKRIRHRSEMYILEVVKEEIEEPLGGTYQDESSVHLSRWSSSTMHRVTIVSVQ